MPTVGGLLFRSMEKKHWAPESSSRSYVISTSLAMNCAISSEFLLGTWTFSLGTSMLYHSTHNPAHRVDLKEAILRSLPPDNGLYMPDSLPVLGPEFWAIWRELTFELVHGPTRAFKDFGARFMARLMAWLTRGEDRELTVLVATSGDTGGAVASAFHQVPGTRVIILYPKGKVSGLQEKQLTALGGYCQHVARAVAVAASELLIGLFGDAFDPWQILRFNRLPERDLLGAAGSLA